MIRLGQKIPFLCGGEVATANLAPVDEYELMIFCAEPANQIKDLPDGASIEFRIE